MYRFFFLLFFLISFNILFSQNRGFRGLNIQIEGKPTTLYSQSHALVIGESDYTNGWSDLPGVSRDVQDVKQALEKHGFNVVVVENPNSQQLKKSFDDFISKYSREYNSRLIIFFSGHGYTMKQQWGGEMGYIIPSDAPNPHTDPEGFKDKAIDMELMEVYAKRMDSKHALFLFDCCFSGSIFSLSKAAPAIINYKTSKPVRQFITAGGADEEVPDESIFCKQFTGGLNGEADLNSDGYISGSELGEYLQTTVVNYSYDAQHPQYGKIRNPNLDKGDFIFVVDSKQQIAEPSVPKISIREEQLTETGSLKIFTNKEGKLEWEHGYLRDVDANTYIVIDDLPVGQHTFTLSTKLIEPNKPFFHNTSVINILANQTIEVDLSPKNKPSTVDTSIPDKQYDGMVYVPGGTFKMKESNEKAVNLNGFYIGTHEVTVEEFKAFVDATAYVTEIEKRGYAWLSGNNRKKVKKVSWRCGINGKPRPLNEYNHPAIFLSKEDAEAYCKWKGGRLPSEAEWEYAALGGNNASSNVYAGSDNIDEVAWYNENSNGTTHPVGQKKPNTLGIYDMSGNVWEYCAEYTDGKGNCSKEPVFSYNHQVARGGSWYYISKFATVTDRTGWRLFGNTNTGFRMVRDR